MAEPWEEYRTTEAVAERPPWEEFGEETAPIPERPATGVAAIPTEGAPIAPPAQVPTLPKARSPLAAALDATLHATTALTGGAVGFMGGAIAGVVEDLLDLARGREPSAEEDPDRKSVV